MRCAIAGRQIVRGLNGLDGTSGDALKLDQLDLAGVESR